MNRNNVLEYLEETAPKFRDKTAYADQKGGMTFGEVYAASRSIGTALLQTGARKEPVAILMKKSPQMVTAFFGCVYAGCLYVPLDDKMPEQRIKIILATCGAKHIILDRALYASKKDRLADMGFAGTVHLYEDMLSVPEDTVQLAEVRANALDIDPVYIVFTSGSTGIPKGVAACHRSVIDYIENLSEVLQVDENTVFGNQSPFYFDACLKELYPTIKFGCTAYIIPKSYFMFPVKLIEFLNEKKINTICWVASALTLVSTMGTFDVVRPQYLRTVAFGSEVFPVKQFAAWREVLPEARFLNLYGPTECTGMSCWYEVGKDFAGDKLPIGKPFRNTGIFLLDENDREADEGEIVIRGTCVTLGYYNNPEKTQEAFVQNPLNSYYPELVYRTGDIARRNDDGDLVFISRKDYQIKHMGHRIELGEIEAAANAVDNIGLCACIYDQNASLLVLFYTGSAQTAEILSGLKGKVPGYMLPNVIRRIDRMPMTENGKLNRRQLKEEYLAKKRANSCG